MNWRQQVTANMAPTADAKMQSELIRKHRIGGAFIHAFGIGHLNSVVNVDQDPNSRGNLRLLHGPHVTNLRNVLSVPGARRDHESPILLAVPRELLTPDLIEKMSRCDPHDPASTVPPLVLRHDRSKELLALETQIFSSIKANQWMTQAEIDECVARLAAIRESSPRAILLNGNHRITVIVSIGEEIELEYSQIRGWVRSGSVPQDEIAQKMEGIAARVPLASYRVEVFDGE